MHDLIAQQDVLKTSPNNKLIYVSPDNKGYRRVLKNGKFIYLGLNGKRIRSPAILNRISGLVIPPAWKNVWICPSDKGHIQVTGIDQRGRKQYRYHSLWQTIRNETKFDRLYHFGQQLRPLRRQIKKDLKRKLMDKAKVSALALSIMEATFIRAGNTIYEKEYGSYGLTTLKNRHVLFAEGEVLFKFRGKKGVKRLVKLRLRPLIRLLKKVKELPGQELFQYYDDTGSLHSLNSSDINDYMKEHMGESFTCKDFRTWAGCVCALEYMLESHLDAQKGTEYSLPQLIDRVAERLGNTRAVCRKYYIHPELIRLYETGKLEAILPRLLSGDQKSLERTLLRFLHKQTGKRG